MLDSNLISLLEQASQTYGVPTSILYAVCMAESGGNPNAHTVTSKEDSRGLFQVNILAHPDANSTQLFDPNYNIQYEVPKLAATYQLGLREGYSGVSLAQYVEEYGERPQWTPTVAARVSMYYNQFINGLAGSSDTTQNEGSTTGMSLIDTTGIMNDIKFYLIYGMLFLLLLFSLYMVFIKNDGGEK